MRKSALKFIVSVIVGLCLALMPNAANASDLVTLNFDNGFELYNYNGGTGTDWNGSGDVINFGNQTGLTAAQLDQIQFNGVYGEAALNSSGDLIQLTNPVPEPSTIALGFLGGLGVFLMRRKKAY